MTETNNLNSEIVRWLTKQIESCDRLLDLEEADKNESTKIAEYFFMKQAYALTLKQINEIIN